MSLWLVACGGGGGGSDSSSNVTDRAEETALQKALRTGDATYVSDPNAFIEHSQQLVNDHKTRFNRIKAAINGSTGALAWDPSHDTALLTPTYGFNDSILMTNRAMQAGYSDQEMTLGVAGEYGKGGKYAVLGSNPYRTSLRFPGSANDAMEQWLRNLIAWLVGRAPEQGMNVAIAQMQQSYYFPDEQATRQWLSAQFGTGVVYNLANDCDGDELLGCVESNPDLLVISQHLRDGDSLERVKAAIQRAKHLEIPVLYLHLDGNMTELGNEVFSLFNVSYAGDNYWRKLGVDAWNPQSIYDQTPDFIEDQITLLQRLKNNSFTVDLSLCDDKSCPDESNMSSEFYAAANSMRSQLMNLDRRKIDLFNSAGYEYEKSLVLLADLYRQEVSFPMDKNATDSLVFLRSYFSDYVQYHSRTINPAQQDMGNFSRSHFGADVARVSKLLQMQSKRNFRSAGVYALPGETFSVTRQDNNPVTTKIVVNSLRSGATHEFSKNGYTRPKFLTSTQYEVKPGETISLTSAYGGPIHVHFDANDIDVELQFEQVAEHPIWRSSADNQKFAQQLNDNLFDWAELMTPGFEVHSKRDKMLKSISSWSTPADMAAATERYVHNFPHVLAGFQGPGIDKVDDIYLYAQNQGWQVANIDIVKHMNADQANCGYGCSGNPYDAYWEFNPLGHGDLHELGHGLEKSRFRFAGWEGHSTTNYYSYYSKSRYFQDTGIDSGCQSLDFKSQYETLQYSRTQADPNAYMAQLNQTSWSWGARVFIQMMMASEHQGVIENGWHLLGRLHLIEREFNRVKQSESTWLAERNIIGFDSYSYADANSISNNDWLLIALSVVSNRDMREYLDMWGFNFSDQAKNLVQSKGLVAMPLTYFAASNTGYCRDEFANRPIAIDGTSVWPL